MRTRSAGVRTSLLLTGAVALLAGSLPAAADEAQPSGPAASDVLADCAEARARVADTLANGVSSDPALPALFADARDALVAARGIVFPDAAGKPGSRSARRAARKLARGIGAAERWDRSGPRARGLSAARALRTVEAALLGVIVPLSQEATADLSGLIDAPAPAPIAAPVATYVSLVPGTGFTADTAEPAAIGTGSTADAQVIARWDVVPYQTFSGTFNVGVVAFHMNGIDRVSLSVEGGPWVDAPFMLNRQTNVWEYTAQLDAADFTSDGLVEIRAIAYPKTAGRARVLGGAIDGTVGGSLHFRNGNHSLFLNVNGKGTLKEPVVWADSVNGDDATGDGSQTKPFKTVAKALADVTRVHGSSDGAICYLQAGDYVWNAPSYPAKVVTTDRWATVTPAPGVNRNEVTFTGNVNGGLATRLVAARGITQNGHGGPRTVTSKDAYFWMDRSAILGSDPNTGGGIVSGSWSGVYATDTVASGLRDTFRSATFVRNCVGANFSDTPISSDATVINVSLDQFIRNVNGDHADIIHWYWTKPGRRENRVVYGLKATRFDMQGFQANSIRGGCQQLDNVALVNVHVSKDASSSAGSWWSIDSQHLVMEHVQFVDQPIRWAASGHDSDGVLTLTDVALRGSVFAQFSYGPLPSDSKVESVHLLTGTSHGAFVPAGTNVTYGERDGGTTAAQVFADSSNRDYRVKRGGVADGRVGASALRIEGDIAGTRRASPAPLGAFATSK